ncbi:hypothetical protein EVAR_25158_1 [Eumeta japonica]|uniref:Uncharacterized protein n=1 Tax=Eumeta variegata TaxID=151549 RepID=A0A4C1VS08_EUMVA|nr:hypothetical protein EVAR_25158_1 [Eumeta japonica]
MRGPTPRTGRQMTTERAARLRGGAPTRTTSNAQKHQVYGTTSLTAPNSADERAGYRKEERNCTGRCVDRGGRTSWTTCVLSARDVFIIFHPSTAKQKRGL